MFFKASPIAMKSIQMLSSASTPTEGAVKAAALSKRPVRAAIFSIVRQSD
jgi:hypothetical protein